MVWAAVELFTDAPCPLVYASQLSNLVPTNVASTRPSVSTIQGFLERANLPAELIAFAACVLDALSQRFASSWRAACSPLQPELNYFSLKQAPSVGSEVVVLSALSLAHGFLSDRDRSTKHWAQLEGACLFTVREIELTKWSILQELEFGLHRITEAMVQRMLRDMRRSTTCPTMPAPVMTKIATEEIDDRRLRCSIDLHGTAVWRFGIQTPEPSP